MQRNWLITGTSSGLGRILTEKLLARGERVAATVRNPQALDELKARYGDRLWVGTLDIADTAAVYSVVEQAFATFGRIDVVVSNAGYGLFGAAEEVNEEQIRRQIDTNLLGSIHLIRAALPHLRKQGGGRVLQVASEGGQIAYPNFSIYHASKWGIEGFVESVAQEVAPFGIEFTLVEPGPTRTNFAAGIDGAQALPEYADTPSGAMRKALASGAFELSGDPDRMTDAMLDCALARPAPHRLTLGAGAYASIRAALQSRLEALEAQREVACGADFAQEPAEATA